MFSKPKPTDAPPQPKASAPTPVPTTDPAPTNAIFPALGTMSMTGVPGGPLNEDPSTQIAQQQKSDSQRAN